MTRDAKILRLLDLLEPEYHNEASPPELGHTEPLDGLICTVLSQNTNDRNRDAAFSALKKEFPEWQDVIDAGAERLEGVIRPAGLAHTKAGRIITILERLHEDFHAYSLKGLAGRTREEICGYLRALPGVGAKTVACVLLFDLKIKAFPVDTHVSRVARRVGVVPERFTPEEICAEFERVIPEGRCLGGHVNMIAHGRAVCHSQKPECGRCVLSGICESSGKYILLQTTQ
ncbi:MAG: endonuclease III [Synergistaceae bacterium]|nr:endonuclease III [Synergistaceae bacterium]